MQGLLAAGRRLGAPLTHGLLAVHDTEATVHAGRQEQVALQGVPPEPPHPTLHRHVCEWLLHIPCVPQQNVLVVAETQQQGPNAGNVSLGQSPLSPHCTLAQWQEGPRNRAASPPCGQDALLVGVTLDAAHPHAMSVTKG